jgi:hypothetical protein
MTKLKKASAQRVAKSFKSAEIVEMRKQMAKGEVGDRFVQLSKAIDELGKLEEKLRPFLPEVNRRKALKEFIKGEFDEFELEDYAGDQFITKAVKTPTQIIDIPRVKIFLGSRLKKFMRDSTKITLVTTRSEEGKS